MSQVKELDGIKEGRILYVMQELALKFRLPKNTYEKGIKSRARDPT